MAYNSLFSCHRKLGPRPRTLEEYERQLCLLYTGNKSTKPSGGQRVYKSFSCLPLRTADTELQDCLRNLVDFMVQRNVGTKEENSFASLGLFISEVLTSFDRAGATERGKRQGLTSTLSDSSAEKYQRKTLTELISQRRRRAYEKCTTTATTRIS